MFFSHVRPDHPRCRSATWICMCGHTRGPVIYSKFHWNPFRGFGALGVKIWTFPLLWLVAFTTACTTVQAVIVLSVWPGESLMTSLLWRHCDVTDDVTICDVTDNVTICDVTDDVTICDVIIDVTDDVIVVTSLSTSRLTHWWRHYLWRHWWRHHLWRHCRRHWWRHFCDVTIDVTVDVTIVTSLLCSTPATPTHM